MSTYILKERVAIERRQQHYVLAVPKSGELEWCVALTLLNEDLASFIETGDRKVSISIDPNLPVHVRGAADVSAAPLRLRLTRTELRAWLYFFLRAVRDGAPDANHFDCELRGGLAPVDLVVTAEGAKKPMTAEEARKRLGL